MDPFPGGPLLGCKVPAMVESRLAVEGAAEAAAVKGVAFVRSKSQLLSWLRTLLAGIDECSCHHPATREPVWMYHIEQSRLTMARRPAGAFLMYLSFGACNGYYGISLPTSAPIYRPTSS